MSFSIKSQIKALAALREYSGHRMQSASLEEWAIDLITDILHIADRDENANPENIMYFAKVHFEAERLPSLEHWRPRP